MCEYGHIGQSFVIGEETNVDVPKGEWHPYCVGCIMLDVVKRAKLKPMRFYIAKTPPGGAGGPGRPEIVLPEHGLFLPGRERGPR